MRVITNPSPVFAHGTWHDTQDDADSARYIVTYTTVVRDAYGPYVITWNTYETAGEAAVAFIQLAGSWVDPEFIANDLGLGTSFETVRGDIGETITVRPL